MASVEHERAPEQRAEALEIRMPIDQPFGDDHERIGAMYGAVGIRRIHDAIAEESARGIRGLGIVRLHSCAGSADGRSGSRSPVPGRATNQKRRPGLGVGIWSAEGDRRN